MASCEKCWARAYWRSKATGKSQAKCYREILKEVEKSGEICTPEEFAGQFWDADKKKDKREDIG